jgi:predicted phage baseplate assembly protein
VPVTRSDFGLSAKITRIAPDYNTDLGDFPLRSAIALVQSEEQVPAEQPLLYPLYGSTVSLEVLRNDMAGVQVIAVSGNRQKIALTVPPSSVANFFPDDGTPSRPLGIGEILTLTSAANLPVDSTGAAGDWSSSGADVTLYLEDAFGRTGSISAAPSCFALSPSAATDPVVAEYAIVSQVDNSATSNTSFGLAAPLSYCYDRTTATVNANVGLATAGQSVTEILGSGSASTPDQEFTLRQSPLTFVQAPTPTGRASTLEVRANGMDWTEVPSLYQASPSASVYSTLNQSDGTTDVLFGDGLEGATLPTGQNNIQASYRIGSGSSGNVAAGALTTLIDRPLGVSGVTNPGPATGGQDPQTVSGIRQNAPQTVLTLGRAVSITDYQNFASTFSGISKAYAIWIPSGAQQGVFLTIAGTNGAELQAGSPTNANLAAALQAYGNPLIPITIQTYVETLFSINANVQYDPAYQQPVVKAQILETLSGAFNFESRAFGQGVSMDEVSTVIQNVPGVVAVNVTSLVRGSYSSQGGDIGQAGAPTVSQWNVWLASLLNPPLARPYQDPPNGLCCYMPMASPLSPPQPAEILVLDPRPTGVVLGVMS